MEADENDQSMFYKIIRKQRGLSSSLPEEMYINGEKVDGDNIIEAMTSYFEELTTPKDSPQYDREAKDRADIKNSTLKRQYLENPRRIMPEVTPQMMIEAYSDLNRNKAPDIGGLKVEHLIHSSPLVADVLAILFNKIIQQQTIPSALTEGYITPVYKKKKSPKDPDNYRRITIKMMINKVLEKILLYPVKRKLIPQLNTLQRGFIRGSSSANTALITDDRSYGRRKR